MKQMTQEQRENSWCKLASWMAKIGAFALIVVAFIATVGFFYGCGADPSQGGPVTAADSGKPTKDDVGHKADASAGDDGSVVTDSGKDTGVDSGADVEVWDVGEDVEVLDGGEDATMPDAEISDVGETDAGEPDAGEDAGDGGTCVAECTGAVCGDPDGCGNKCQGTCAGSQDICNPQTFVCECQPLCVGDSCGHDDGCGKRCEDCASVSQYCDTRVWVCREKCTQYCVDKTDCDSWCAGGNYICQNHSCVACAPNCSGKFCGEPDGCGGTCQACGVPSDVCVSSPSWRCCTPFCPEDSCGLQDDGCGKTCEVCPDGSYCDKSTDPWHCCVPSCNGKTCGEPDGCGGKCVNCSQGQYCDQSVWSCLNKCDQTCTLDADCDGWCGDTSHMCLEQKCTQCSSAPAEGTVCADSSACGCLGCITNGLLGVDRGNCLRGCEATKICGDTAEQCLCLSMDPAVVGECATGGWACAQHGTLTGFFSVKVASVASDADCVAQAEVRPGSLVYAGITFDSFRACRMGDVVRIASVSATCSGQPCDINQLEVKVYALAVRMGQVPVSYQLTAVHKHNGIGVKGVAAAGYISFSGIGVGNGEPMSGMLNMTIAKFTY